MTVCSGSFGGQLGEFFREPFRDQKDEDIGDLGGERRLVGSHLGEMLAEAGVAGGTGGDDRRGFLPREGRQVAFAEGLDRVAVPRREGGQAAAALIGRNARC